jgi:hypothetical protein
MVSSDLDTRGCLPVRDPRITWTKEQSMSLSRSSRRTTSLYTYLRTCEPSPAHVRKHRRRTVVYT